jgi:hypothetical protein
MANPKVVVISLSDDEPEVQALVARWRAEGVNVSRMFVKAAKKTFIEPEMPIEVETLATVRRIETKLSETIQNIVDGKMER